MFVLLEADFAKLLSAAAISLDQRPQEAVIKQCMATFMNMSVMPANFMILFWRHQGEEKLAFESNDTVQVKQKYNARKSLTLYFSL